VKLAQDRASTLEKDLSLRDGALDSVRGELDEIGKSFEALAAFQSAVSDGAVEPSRTDPQTAHNDAATLARELELTRAEADQLLAFVVERQAEYARENEARTKAEHAVSAAEARIRELTEKLTQLERGR